MDELHVLLAMDNYCIYADESIPSVSIKNITPETSLLSIIIPIKQNKTKQNLSPPLVPAATDIACLSKIICIVLSPIPS